MISRLYKNILFALICTVSIWPNVSLAAAQPYYYLITYKKPAGVLVTAKINDTEVVKSLNGTFSLPAINTSNINAWLTSGTNTLSFVAKRAPNAKAFTSSTEIIISRIVAGQKTNEGETLTYIVIPAKDLKGTVQVTKDFSVTTTPPSDFWQQAKPLKITQITKAVLTWEVYKTWQTVHTKNIDRIFNLFKYQFDEINRYNFEQVYSEVDFKNSALQPLIENELQPLPNKPLHFELIANKKIIKVTDDTGHSPIKIGTGEIDFLTAPVNGAWTLVR